MTCSHTPSPCTVNTIGELLFCAVHHSALPPKAIADALGVRHNYLLDAANPSRSDVAFQLRLLPSLIRVTGRTDLMAALAAMTGGAYVALPAADASLEREALVLSAARMASALGNLLRELSDLETPGSVPRASARCRDLTAECLQLSASLSQACDTTPMALRRSA